MVPLPQVTHYLTAVNLSDVNLKQAERILSANEQNNERCTVNALISDKATSKTNLETLVQPSVLSGGG